VIRGLLLCGGRSSRFGSDKLLASFDDSPLVAHSARHVIEALGNALAVIPPGAASLHRALESVGCDVLESPDTARGLGASLAAGVAACADAEGWIVALGDMPFIRPSTIAALRESLAAGALLAAPRLIATGQRGHPVGFSRALYAQLVEVDGDEGARSLIAAHRDKLVLLEVDDPGIVKDVDTPSDLEGR
jgi:molybdenum cofactor cytidylyltransferase